MKKKSFDGLSGQLSRTQMKSITAGKPFPDLNCAEECICNSGTSYLKNGSCYCDSGYSLPCSTGTNQG